MAVQAAIELDNKAAHCHTPVQSLSSIVLSVRPCGLPATRLFSLRRPSGAPYFFDRISDHAVQRLNGLGCVDDFADVCRVSEKRRQVGPV